jgi:peptidylprolyl isomerase
MFRVFIILLTFLSINCFSKEKDIHEEEISKFYESLGHIIGKNLEEIGMKVDVSQVMKGIKNAQDGKKSPMTEEECLKAFTSLQEKYLKILSEKNLKEASELLSKNHINTSIIELEGGKVQYQIIIPGKGERLQIYHSPIVRYTGKYLNGTKFISLEEKISLNEIIPGFSKGLVGMKEGEKRIIYIHPDLGFGKNSNPPNALLIFEVELLQLEGKLSKMPNEIADKKNF